MKERGMGNWERRRIDLKDPQYYFNRELSWLEFNSRILQEASDPRTPLLERLKFSAIFSSNLDEFFMVRVAGLKKQVEAGVTQLTPDGRDPAQQLVDISERLRPLVQQQDRHFQPVLRRQLADEGIYLLDYADLNSAQRTYLHQYFQTHIFPVLTPLAVDPSHPFPYISNLSLNLAVVLREAGGNDELLARVKVPQVLPRFVPLPPELGQRRGSRPPLWRGVPLEQIVAHHLEALFPGLVVQECHAFRVTRNADLSVEEEADDLLLAMEQELRKRRVAQSAVRLEIQASTPETLKERLMQELGLEEMDAYAIESWLGLKDLLSLLSLPRPDLKDPPWTPTIPSWAYPGKGRNRPEEEGIFSAIRRRDRLVHHPYQSFSATVQQAIAQAARDPKVLAIKMTLYRTSGDSPIVSDLVAAAENGKQVAVLVELKARFDEENNILWARRLEQSGVHVVYGVRGLKTHTKIALIVRQEENAIRRYVHIGTGNYNPKTANFYTDLGLLSCREDLGADLTELFNYLTGYSQQQSYRKLLVAPVNLREHLEGAIRREAEHCRQGGRGRIVAKMNALVDPPLIEALYEASQAGVAVDLIVRGICCLRPGVEGVSENIRVISIIGRFLEHSRIFYFYNGGQEEISIGSADWMTRNLNRRVEAVTPVDAPELAKDLEEILGILLSDHRQAWELQPDGRYLPRHPQDSRCQDSAQSLFMKMALKPERQEARGKKQKFS